MHGDVRLGSRARTWQHAEVDVNPGWKRSRGEPHVQLTTVALGAQMELARGVDVSTGWDMRRDLLLPEQRGVPDTLLSLDRTQGISAALHLRISSSTSLRLGTNLRRRGDGTRTTRAWDATLYGSLPAMSTMTGIVHANLYDAAPGHGDLVDASLSYRVSGWLRLDVAAGSQRSQGVDIEPQGPGRRSNWMRVGGGLASSRGPWIDVSAEWRTDPATRELHLEVGERF
jgi:hypothetical protein